MLDPFQRDIVIRTIAGEADPNPEGWAAVAWNIRNRSEDGRWPSDPAKVALQPKQYSAWNKGAGGNRRPWTISPQDAEYEQIGQVVDGVYGGAIHDPTDGAVFYYAPRGMAGGKKPSWYSKVAKEGGPRVVGTQVFMGKKRGGQVYDPLSGKLINAGPMPQPRVLERGMGTRARPDEQVRQWQSFLTTMGYDPGPADGSFGRKTQAATEQFQAARGLKADGVVGQRTRDAAALTPTSDWLASLQPPSLLPGEFSSEDNAVGGMRLPNYLTGFVPEMGGYIGDPSAPVPPMDIPAPPAPSDFMPPAPAPLAPPMPAMPLGPSAAFSQPGNQALGNYPPPLPNLRPVQPGDMPGIPFAEGMGVPPRPMGPPRPPMRPPASLDVTAGAGGGLPGAGATGTVPLLPQPSMPFAEGMGVPPVPQPQETPYQALARLQAGVYSNPMLAGRSEAEGMRAMPGAGSIAASMPATPLQHPISRPNITTRAEWLKAITDAAGIGYQPRPPTAPLDVTTANSPFAAGLDRLPPEGSRIPDFGFAAGPAAPMQRALSGFGGSPEMFGVGRSIPQPAMPPVAAYGMGGSRYGEAGPPSAGPSAGTSWFNDVFGSPSAEAVPITRSIVPQPQSYPTGNSVISQELGITSYNTDTFNTPPAATPSFSTSGWFAPPASVPAPPTPAIPTINYAQAPPLPSSPMGGFLGSPEMFGGTPPSPVSPAGVAPVAPAMPGQPGVTAYIPGQAVVPAEPGFTVTAIPPPPAPAIVPAPAPLPDAYFRQPVAAPRRQPATAAPKRSVDNFMSRLTSLLGNSGQGSLGFAPSSGGISPGGMPYFTGTSSGGMRMGGYTTPGGSSWSWPQTGAFVSPGGHGWVPGTISGQNPVFSR